jgi:uncharacterized 2Fe-2S/4Fe-4S cluster protein (DUF4445 family)
LKKRKEAKELAEKMDYVELAGAPDFTGTFAKAMRLG